MLSSWRWSVSLLRRQNCACCTPSRSTARLPSVPINRISCDQLNAQNSPNATVTRTTPQAALMANHCRRRRFSVQGTKRRIPHHTPLEKRTRKADSARVVTVSRSRPAPQASETHSPHCAIDHGGRLKTIATGMAHTRCKKASRFFESGIGGPWR